VSKHRDETGGLPLFFVEECAPFGAEMYDKVRATSIERLRERARQPIERCECCGGGTKVYRRKLNSGMARALIALWRHRGHGWVRLASVEPGLVAQVQGDLSKLALWGLAETAETDSDAKKNSGAWRLTGAGRDFVMSRTRLPSHVFVRSPGGAVLGFEASTTGIVESLGRHFDYQQLMRGEG
jgi:hypothetical protein